MIAERGGRRPRAFTFARAVAVCAALSGAGCSKGPKVRADALSARPRLAVVSFQSEPVSDIGLPVRLEELDSAYAAFVAALEAAGFDVVPVESVRQCGWYRRLPMRGMDRGTTATGLSRVQLTGREVSGLATCAGAEVVVAVYGWPKLDTGLHLKFGQGRVGMRTHVLAWDDHARELWRDRLVVFSEPYPITAAVSDRPRVAAAATKALAQATVESVERLVKALAPTAAPEVMPSQPPQ